MRVQRLPNLYLLLLVLIALVTISFWFVSGKQLAGGEGGFAIFNHTRLEDKISPWQKFGTGGPYPFYLSFLFPAVMVGVLLDLGVSLIVSQAIFFFLLLSSGMLGMYVLTAWVLRDHKNYQPISFLASIFYFLNLFTLSQIINRFILSGIFLWAYLPLFLYQWTNLLKSFTVRKLVYFLITSFVFSAVLLHPGNILTLWTVAGVWTLIEIFKDRKDFAKIIKTSVIVFIFWALSNLWLFIPYNELAGEATSYVSEYSYNFDLVSGLSTYFPNSQIVILRQKGIFDQDFHLYDFYKQPPIILISVCLFILMLLGLWKTKKKKFITNLLGILFIGWFISKGTNFPLGSLFYKVMFKLLPFTMVWRNSYEKFGVVWVLAYSIFLSLGVYWLYTRISGKFPKVLILLFYALATFFLCWPLLTGRVFADSVFVTIPDYYSSANNFINQDGKENRILMLPIHRNDSVRYNWGFIGIEPSEYIFDKPAVSRPLTGRYDSKYKALYEAFTQGQNYNPLLEEMNIGYLVHRNDVDLSWEHASSSAQVKQTLAKNSAIKYLKSFGELDIYAFVPEKSLELFTLQPERPNKIDMDYHKLKNNKYQVSIRGAKENYTLIFKETFHPNWTARVGNTPLDNHFVAYGYANGWHIDQKGDYTIEVVLKIWPWD